MGHTGDALPGKSLPVESLPKATLPTGGRWIPYRRPMDPADYQVLWSLDVREATFGPVISLSVTSAKNLENTKLPNTRWTKAEFPNLESGAIDQYQPIFYGRTIGAKATAIDITAKKFRVAGHGITRFLNVYTEKESASIEDTNLALGEFVWPGWNGTDAVYCDFDGILGPPPDLIEDAVETRAGLTGELYKPASAEDPFAGLGFGTYGSRADWIIGHDDRGREVVRPQVSLAIREPTSLKEIIEKIQAASFAFPFPARNGQLLFRAWGPTPSDGRPRLKGRELNDVERVSSLDKIITRVNVTYAAPVDANLTPRVYTLADEGARQAAGLTAHVDLNVEVALAHPHDVIVFASRLLAFNRAQPYRWQMKASLSALEYLPGDGVTLLKKRPGLRKWIPLTEIDEYVCVTGVELSDDAKTIRLRVIDWHGITGEGPCYITADDAAFPADLGGGDMTVWDPAWTPEQKRHAKENGGFVSDDNELIDPADPDTWRRSVAI